MLCASLEPEELDMITPNYLPPTVPATRDLETLTALMKLIADPHNAKVHVEQLAKASDELRTRKAEHDKAQADLQVQMTTHTETIKRERAEHEAAIAKSQADHDAELQRKSVALTARAVAAD